MKHSNYKSCRTIVIGGGSAGLFFAAKYGDSNTLVLERGERTGRKLSATGGGWGNVTNLRAAEQRERSGGAFFTFEKAEQDKIAAAVKKFSPESLREFLLSLGVPTFADERGRVYPLSRQASALTDCLRKEALRRGVEIKTGEMVQSVRRVGSEYEVKTQSGTFYAEYLVICTGGKAAKNFGSDGNGYELAKALNHTITPLFPALVQIKCAEKQLRALKGIRVFDGAMSLFFGDKLLAREHGDILFTDYGVSGDCAFKISSYLPYPSAMGFDGENGRETACKGGEKSEALKCVLKIDFLPDVTIETIENAIENRLRKDEYAADGELFVGILNNRLGLAVAEQARNGCPKNQKNCINAADSAREKAIALASGAKQFLLTVTGTLGFDYAQVTKGGVRLCEVNEDLSSKKMKNLFFAGEILDVDGACGGFNLQWAYSSACTVGEAIGLQ